MPTVADNLRAAGEAVLASITPLSVTDALNKVCSDGAYSAAYRAMRDYISPRDPEELKTVGKQVSTRNLLIEAAFWAEERGL